MRFLHTADWHLGRLFHQKHLTEDQAFVLRQLIAIAKDQEVDAIVVAGDVYDRGVPPPDAVRLLDDVLAELLLGLKVPVILAAGNHDSPERLAFGSRLLAQQGLYLFGLPSSTLDPVVLGDEHGEVAFYVAPYAEPALVRERLSDEAVVDHESGMRALVASMTARRPRTGRSVFVGHAFVHGALGSDSERPLSVGGAGAIDASCFDGFHYVALGHLHRPQDVLCVGQAALATVALAKAALATVALAKAARLPAARYAGAILKYSFDEVGQDRTVTIVDIDGAGAVRTEDLRLVPRRELRRVEGTLDELLLGGAGAAGLRSPGEEGLGPRSFSEGGPGLRSFSEGGDDYIVAKLLDRHPVLDPIGRLRAIYPNVLSIERPAVVVGPEGRTQGDRRQLGHAQLFAAFFQEVTGQAPTPDEQAVFDAVAGKLADAEREVLA